MATQRWMEWLGAISGLLGASLLASNSTLSGIGFVVFLVSNLCWIVFGWKTRTHSLMVMQAGYTLTSVIGIYRWLA